MKYSFGHSICATDLYTRCDETLSDKSEKWFRNTLGFKANRHEYFGHLLTYTFDLIIQHILEHKQRFVGPLNLFYIDLETFAEDDFMQLRRKGKFQDIDIVESDFKGYQLTYYYKAYKSDAYYKKHNIYTGSKHQKLLANHVNNGEVMYSLRDVRLKRFIPKVCEYCPGLTKHEANRIIMTGMTRMYYAIKQGCYVSLDSKRLLESLFFVGRFYLNPERQIKDYFFRYRMKAKKLLIWSKEPKWNHHYIGIDIKRMQEWSKLNGTARPHKSWVWFEDVVARKQLDVVCRNSTNIYIFELTMQKKYQWKLNHYIDKAKYKDVKYIGRGINYKFYPEDKDWKELILEFKNEEGNS